MQRQAADPVRSRARAGHRLHAVASAGALSGSLALSTCGAILSGDDARFWRLRMARRCGDDRSKGVRWPAQEHSENKKAYHDYFVDETFETGIALTGTEVKSLRENRASCASASPPCEAARCGCTTSTSRRTATATAATSTRTGRASCCCTRRRSATSSARPRSRGARSSPSRCTSPRTGWRRSSSAWSRGKKLYDKRDTIAKRDQERDVERAMRERQKGSSSRADHGAGAWCFGCDEGSAARRLLVWPQPKPSQTRRVYFQRGIDTAAL